MWQESEGQIANMGYYVACIVFCWLLLPLLMLAWRYMATAAHVYSMTSERIQESTGVLSRHTEVLELYRVKDLVVEQPLLQRLAGRGRVTLVTSDRSTPTVVLNCITDPRGVADMIRANVERCRVSKGVREID